MLGNGPRQAIGLRTWIQKCKYELDLSDVVRCATHFASGKISTDADKDRKVEPNQPGELEAVRTHERIAPLTRSSPCEDYCDSLQPLEHAIEQLSKVIRAAWPEVRAGLCSMHSTATSAAPASADRPRSSQRLGSTHISSAAIEPITWLRAGLPTPEPWRRLRVLSSRLEMKEKRNGSHTGDRQSYRI